MVGGIQPGVLRHLRGEGDDADADDGWVPRFLLSWPDAEPLELSETAFDARTLAPAVAIFRGLRRYGSEPHDTLLSPAAYARFRDWHGDNRRAQIATRSLERQWAAKAPIHLARLALVLHLMADPVTARPLSAETMADAIELLEYFRGHLARALPAFGAAVTVNRQMRILRILRTHETDSSDRWVGRSTIYNGLRNVKPDDLTAALEALEASGQIERHREPTPTKPAEQWRTVHHETKKRTGEDSDYSDNSAAEGNNQNNQNLHASYSHNTGATPADTGDPYAGGEEGIL
jgi:hypothetical protein